MDRVEKLVCREHSRWNHKYLWHVRTVGYVLGVQQKSRGAQTTNQSPIFYSSWNYLKQWKNTHSWYANQQNQVDVTTDKIFIRMI